ncbi:peroxisomal Pex24-like protein [Cryphonectria parasitica EP155]|uniref:Peroxisomal Pex24-like protein n=1 Tax=Cryphonectria parasitica (strain ATCC 38755 / EP155) TaxID=660469 RepID=A0A9P5CKS8_CRYP1|nr:peroxisomal Pex24-like protein [Cryphonectria parasitica EP155]KAF3761090.1 peroxisomal Pex24-like protein [Cryphonectria parasitica EP155]
MDDATSDILNAVDESTLQDGDVLQSPEKDDGKDKSKSRWRGLSALKAQASMQDKLLEKLLHQVIPTEDLAPGGHVQDTPVPADSFPSYESTRPPFAMATMATNFTRFNARIGVVFKFQSRAIRLLSWRQPSQTLSFLAVYTLVCLDPYLLTVLPLAAALVGVFIPSFMARHPSDSRELAYSPRGPPRAPARTVKPARQMSSHFMRNMRDLQNCMEDFSRGHDQVVTVVVPKTNFSDEALSSGLFVALFGLTLFMTIAAHLLPWRAITLCGGWAAVVSGHPTVASMMRETQAAYFPPPQQQAKSLLDSWIAEDIILDSAPETREVEIFELQHRDASNGEWEPWVFSPSPYDPLSQARITGDRPRGTRFFEDVLAPEGWEWSEKKWALDLWSREWVEERIITGVEVETEGERWVYDMFNENEGASGVREHVDVVEAGSAAAKRRLHLSWEEGEEGEGRRGEWRRRRWVRLVKRRMTKEAI